MSVIAKMSVRSIDEFGSGRLITLGCVCENDLMAAYAGSEEDKLFTKYSPWGEIKLHQPQNFILSSHEGDAFYVILLRSSERVSDSFEGAYAWGTAKVVSLTDFVDNQAKRVEISDGHRKDEQAVGIASLNWKMSVDNPPATEQFKPGVDDYYIAFYPCEKYDRNAAIAAATH